MSDQALARTISIGGVDLTLWTVHEGISIVLSKRKPAEQANGDGETVAIYGPNPELRTITITGRGGRSPDLSTLSLPSVQDIDIEWPDCTNETISALVLPPAEMDMNYLDGIQGWEIRAHERAP